MAIICCIINKNDTFSLVILKKSLKINKIKTSLLKLIELFIILKNICNIKLALIPEILKIIIK